MVIKLATKKLGSKVLTGKILELWIGQTFKTIDTLIIPTIVTNNQPVTDHMGGSNNQKLSGDKV